MHFTQPLPSDFAGMPQFELLLAESVIEEHFGNNAKIVTSELIKKQYLTLQQLCFYCKISPKQLKEIIFILIQHRIIKWEERIENTKTNTVYSVDLSNIFIRPIFPFILKYVERSFLGDDDNVGSSFVVKALKHVFLNGIVPYEWFCQSNELKNSLKQLINERLLKVITNETTTKREADQTIGVKRKLSVQEVVSKGKKINSASSGNLEVKELFGEGSYFQLNSKSFVDLFRYERIVGYFRSKYNQSTADIVEVILKIHFKNDYSGSVTIFSINQLVQSENTFLSPFDRKSPQPGQSTGVPDQLLDEYLDLICEDCSKIFWKKDGIIIVSERALSQQIQSVIFQSLIKERFGTNGMRIFNLLVFSKNFLDDKLVIPLFLFY